MAENPDRPHIEHQQADTAVNAENIGSLSIVYETARRPAPHMVAGKPFLFVGREQLQADVLSALLLEGDNPGPVALVGMGGAGKSTLCVTLAGLPEVAQALEGGVLLAMLGPEPDLMTWLAVWGKQLGEDLADLPSVEARSRSLSTLLFDKKILLVVDDVWNAEHALPFLVGGKGCREMVTTRDSEAARALALDPAMVIQVGPLADDSAFELLYKLAPQPVAANPAGVQRLIARLGGLPLALVLAGRDLSEEWGAGLGVDDLLAELESRDGRLSLRGAGGWQDRAPGGASLAAILGASYSRLPSDAHRRAFRSLGVFGGRPNSFTIQALAAVWELERRPAQKLLLALLNRMMVEKASGERYALHALLADYASSLLTPDEEALARLRHARFFFETAKGYEDEIERWPTVDPDWENVRQAASWTSRQAGREKADPELVEMCAGFAGRVGRLIRIRKPADGLDWLRSGVDACRRLGRGVEEAWLLLALGDTFLDLGQMDEAFAANRRSLELFESGGEASGARYARGNLAVIHRVRGEYAQAFAEYQQVTEQLEQAGDSFGAAVGDYNLGDVSLELGRLEDASRFFDRSLAGFRAIPDSEDRLATVLARTAELRIAMGALDQAQVLAEEALRLAAGAASLSAMPCRSLGRLWGKKNDPAKAEKYFLESIRLSEEAHMQEELAEALQAFGSYLAETGYPGQARERLETAMGIYQAMGAASRAGRVHDQLEQIPP